MEERGPPHGVVVAQGAGCVVASRVPVGTSATSGLQAGYLRIPDERAP